LNPYLTKVGETVKPVRDLLNWTQAELAKQTGLSRATIVNIESEPWRVTRTSSLAIFSVILAEVARRTRLLEDAAQQKYIDWQDLLRELGLTHPKAWSRILGPVELVATGLIPVIGGLITASTPPSLTPEDQQKLHTAAVETLNELSTKLCQTFDLEELSLDCFVTKMVEQEQEQEK
jgi:DNA-binding XRE family transcriptional regulator